MPLLPHRESYWPFIVAACSRVFPVAYWPPAESEMLVPSSGFFTSGTVSGSLGAATSAVASGGGAPVGPVVVDCATASLDSARALTPTPVASRKDEVRKGWCVAMGRPIHHIHGPGSTADSRAPVDG